MTRMGTDKQLDSLRKIHHDLHYAHTRKQGNIGLGFVLGKTFECSFVKNSVRGNPDWQFGFKSFESKELLLLTDRLAPYVFIIG